MPHFLDVGFHWTDTTANGSPPARPVDAATLSFAFERADRGFQGEEGAAAGQKDFRAKVDDRFEIRVFELTRTPGVDLVSIEVSFENIGSTDHAAPSPQLAGVHSPNPPQGKQNVPSKGLNALGTAWFPTGAHKLRNEGIYLITIRVHATMHGSPGHWLVDPKLIVGDGP